MVQLPPEMEELEADLPPVGLLAKIEGIDPPPEDPKNEDEASTVITQWMMFPGTSPLAGGGT